MLVFLGEPFWKKGTSFFTAKNSLSFLKFAFSEPIKVVGYEITELSDDKISARIDCEDFYSIPYATTTIGFVKKSILNPFFLKKYIVKCFAILDANPDVPVWIRNPSVGALIFSLCAMRRNRQILNHMCANIMNAWDNPKYNGVTSFFARMFSVCLKKMVIKVSSYQRGINLCTGDELHKFCLQYNKNSFHFIDSSLGLHHIKDLEQYNKHAKTENTFNFLFIGRVQFDKGIVELLDAFVKIPKDNITLNVVGEGKLLKHLKEKYKDVKNIFFWGSLSNNKIPVAILNSHVIVVPSNNKYEGFPRVILESWLFGKPVIVSNVGGINALVKDRSNGLIYDNHNEGELACKLYEITDKDLYSQLSEGALKMRDVSLADYWKNVLLSIMNSFNK